MLPDRVSNPGPLTYESDALPIKLRGPAHPPLRPQPYSIHMPDSLSSIKGKRNRKEKKRKREKKRGKKIERERERERERGEREKKKRKRLQYSMYVLSVCKILRCFRLIGLKL